MNVELRVTTRGPEKGCQSQTDALADIQSDEPRKHQCINLGITHDKMTGALAVFSLKIWPSFRQLAPSHPVKGVLSNDNHSTCPSFSVYRDCSVTGLVYTVLQPVSPLLVYQSLGLRSEHFAAAVPYHLFLSLLRDMTHCVSQSCM